MNRTTVSRVLGVIVLIALVAPFLIYAVPGVVGAEHGFVVLTGSMSPAIEPGDVVIVDETDPDAVEMQDREYPAISIDNRIRKWPSEAALLADVALDDALAARVDELVTARLDEEFGKRRRDGAQFVVGVPDGVGVDAGEVVGELARRVGGGGGGPPDFAQGGGPDADALDDALDDAPGVLRTVLNA